MADETDMVRMVESVPTPAKLRASFEIAVPAEALAMHPGADGLERALDAADAANAAGRKGAVVAQIFRGPDDEDPELIDLVIKGAFFPHEQARQFVQLSKDLLHNEYSALYTALRNLVSYYESMMRNEPRGDDDEWLPELAEARAALAAIDGTEKLPTPSAP